MTKALIIVSCNTLPRLPHLHAHAHADARNIITLIILIINLELTGLHPTFNIAFPSTNPFSRLTLTPLTPFCRANEQ